MKIWTPFLKRSLDFYCPHGLEMTKLGWGLFYMCVVIVDVVERIYMLHVYVHIHTYSYVYTLHVNISLHPCITINQHRKITTSQIEGGLTRTSAKESEPEPPEPPPSLQDILEVGTELGSDLYLYPPA